MNDYENGIITGRIGLGVDYYKGEKGDKPVKGVDYFTQEDIDEIAAYIEGEGIDLSDYAKKEDVEQAIADIVFPAETDPVFTASAASAITPADISSWNSKSDFSGDYEDLTNKPTIPTKTSELTNDSDFVAQSELNDYATVSYVDQGIVAMRGAIDEVNTNLDTRVPEIPTEDGNYKLTTSISYGIPTTEWVESSGGSYTFTNGLTENNGTVSWNLNDRIKAGTGNWSVAEGYRTKAAGLRQHVEGKYNVVDSNSIFQNIAGNGHESDGADDNNVLSNSFARDWNGNEYLAGNLYVGCNDYSTTANGLITANAGGSKVATESYVDQAIADIPSSSGSKEHIDLSENIFSLFSSGVIRNFSPGYGGVKASSSIEKAGENLKNDKITYTTFADSMSPQQLNTAMGTSYGVFKFVVDFTQSNPVSSQQYGATSTAEIKSAGTRNDVALVMCGNKIYCVEGGLDVLRNLFGYNLAHLIRIDSSSSEGSNYVSGNSLNSVIKQLDNAIISLQQDSGEIHLSGTTDLGDNVYNDISPEGISLLNADQDKGLTINPGEMTFSNNGGSAGLVFHHEASTDPETERDINQLILDGQVLATEDYVNNAIENIPSSGGGATYTAGNGISIDSNGVISLDLSSAEGVGF